MKTVRVEYYSLLREQAGRPHEEVTTGARTPIELWSELERRYAFTLPKERLRVAIDDEFCDWQKELSDGSTVVFIPPVAGG